MPEGPSAEEVLAEFVDCPRCAGQGQLPDPNDDDRWGEICPACGGNGRLGPLAHLADVAGGDFAVVDGRLYAVCDEDATRFHFKRSERKTLMPRYLRPVEPLR